MSAWYILSGAVRLRQCPEVNKILDELRDLRGDEFEVSTTDASRGAIDVTFRGDSEFTDEGADELDAMLRSLGRYAVELAEFTGAFDGRRRVIRIDPADWSHPEPRGIPIRGIVR